MPSRASANPVDPLDPGVPCAVSFGLEYNGTPIVGVPITIYKVAVMNQRGNYFTLDGSFAGTDVDVNAVDTASGNLAVAHTLLDHATANQVTGQVATTSKNGTAQFNDLSDGIYLVAPGLARGFDAIAPYLITLPELQSDGSWVYEVTALPKTQLAPLHVPTPTPTPHNAQTGGRIVPFPVWLMAGLLAAGVGAGGLSLGRRQKAGHAG